MIIIKFTNRFICDMGIYFDPINIVPSIVLNLKTIVIDCNCVHKFIFIFWFVLHAQCSPLQTQKIKKTPTIIIIIGYIDFKRNSLFNEAHFFPLNQHFILSKNFNQCKKRFNTWANNSTHSISIPSLYIYIYYYIRY